MKVKILRVGNNELVDAEIKEGKKLKLPSIQNGWRFNFPKHSKSTGAHTFVLLVSETPEVIEGCLIYKETQEKELYLAYIEIAPHNQGNNKKYDLVAGCLIAFACKQSFILIGGESKGWLSFHVKEETAEGQKKLMTMYSKKYKARKFDETTMYILPEDGEWLIKKYLNR